jgi:hypothetical protein
MLHVRSEVCPVLIEEETSRKLRLATRLAPKPYSMDQFPCGLSSTELVIGVVPRLGASRLGVSQASYRRVSNWGLVGSTAPG